MSDDILHRIEGESRERHKRVRAIIAESGGPEAVAEFDRNMKDIQTGVMHARNIWHTISPRQRHVLALIGMGFEPHGAVKTIHALEKRELVTTAGAKAAITEHGAFVLVHGPHGDRG